MIGKIRAFVLIINTAAEIYGIHEPKSIHNVYREEKKPAK